MRKDYITVSLIAAFLFFAGCGGVTMHVKKGELRDVLPQEFVEKHYIQTIGIGAADESMRSKTQRRSASRNAAIVMAHYEMLSIVKGIKLVGGVTVEKAMETDSRILSVVDDSIKGTEIIQTEWTEDDGCVVTLRLDRKRFEEQIGEKFD